MKSVSFWMVLLTPACLASVPVAAQDLLFSPRHTLACLERSADFDSCIGTSTGQCIEDNGYATVVESWCASMEADWWDGRLNAAYQQAMASAREADGVNGDYAPSQVETLRGMQRAWIPFRDRTCEFEASQWGGGTGAGPAYSACLMWMTAQQTRYLETAMFP